MSKYILSLSIYSEKSFEGVDNWEKELKLYSSPDVKVFLIGNKIDLEDERVISSEQGLQMQKDYEFHLFIETSAKTGFNAEKLFIEAGKVLYNEYMKLRNQSILSGDHIRKKVELKRDVEEKKSVANSLFI